MEPAKKYEAGIDYDESGRTIENAGICGPESTIGECV